MTDSAEAFARAKAVMPGGVSSPVRAHAAVGGAPRTVARANGAELWDIDGNRYLDLCSSWGPLILGHAHPEVIEAITQAAAEGTSFGAPTLAETELAELIVDAVSCVDRVRFVSSGTEAAMSAVRVARAATGRDKIIKFEGCYHGHADPFLVSAGSGALTHGVPDASGVTAAAARDTLVLPFNDLAATTATLSSQAIAAVIVEPVAGNMGVVPPAPGFLEGLRQATARSGCLLIMDEVITGFRSRFGALHERWGIEADLVVLGKIIGGGMPLAAYGGAAELMALVAPEGPVYQAGTLSGNPVAVAAGLTTLRVLRRDDPYGALDAGAARIAETLTHLGLTVQREGSMFTSFWNDAPVTDLASAKRSDTAAFAAWFARLLEAGIWWPPSQFEAAFMSVPLLDHLAELEDLLASSLA